MTTATWQNWGRTASALPARVERPATEEEVATAVRRAAEEGGTVKAVGSGHSFTDIAATDGVQLDLSRLAGLVHADPATGLVTLRAGTRLRDIPPLLAPYGLAMANLGDIDAQTISGAVSTGTHGTGLRFGGLATQVVGVRLVDGRGEVVAADATHQPELVPALSLGLGAFGVLTEVTLQCVPAFLLRAVERPEPLEDVLASWSERARAVDHVEFYWFPHTRTAATKTNTRLPLEAGADPLPGWRRRLDDGLSNGLFEGTCRLTRRVPAVTPVVNQVAARLMANRTFCDASPNVFTTQRSVRFRETEYAVPLDALPDAARALVALVERRGWRVSFPVEFRAAAGDDRWLSTAHGRDSGYVAVHRYWRDPQD
ncbi:MAG TPA: D-arabinono-1,4-lactone oxidase, partial [Ornithinicoccus sp.]|nr:D-arabinono-1,4-lactone oxidase [Ornithinicoccus sp.]